MRLNSNDDTMHKLDPHTKVMLWTAYLFQLEADSLNYIWPPNEIDQEQAEYLEALATCGILETFRKAGLIADCDREKTWKEAVISFSKVGAI